jgi:surface polysaccharide O-acyltransferase-like enzyme
MWSRQQGWNGINSNQAETDRIVYIDLIETIAIIMVIFCHELVIGTSAAANIILQFTTVTAVPLFFMANGALLLNARGFSLRRHIRRTVFVFTAVVGWKLIYYLVMLLIFGDAYREIPGTELFRYCTGLNMSDPYIPAEHFWFMYALLGIYMIFPFIKIAYDEHREVIIFLCAVLFFFVFFYTDYSQIAEYLRVYRGMHLISFDALKTYSFPFAEGADELLFFLTGGLVHERNYQKKTSQMERIVTVGILAAAFGVLLFQKYLQTGTFHMIWVRLDKDYQRTAAYVLSFMIFRFFCIQRKIPLPKLFRFFSMRTMNIYAVHYMLCYLYLQFLFPYYPEQNLGIHTLRTVAVLFASIAVTEWIRFVPGLRSVLGIRPVFHWKKVPDSGISG